MNAKTVAALVFVLFGMLLGAMLFIAYYGDSSYARSPIFFPVVGIAVVCVVAGCVLAFTRLLDSYTTRALRQMQVALIDDVDDLGAGHVTRPWLMLLTTFVTALIFGVLVLRFHQLEAMWGPLPVALATGVAVAVCVLILRSSRWFQDHEVELPALVYLIPLFGIMLSTYLGISNTEDPSYLNLSVPRDGYRYVYAGRAFFLFASDSASTGSSADVPDCDGEACAVMVLIIALVLLAIVLIAGSATIPHFWFLAGGIFLCLMVMFTLRALMARPERRRAASPFQDTLSP